MFCGNIIILNFNTSEFFLFQKLLQLSSRRNTRCQVEEDKSPTPELTMVDPPTPPTAEEVTPTLTHQDQDTTTLVVATAFTTGLKNLLKSQFSISLF